MKILVVLGTRPEAIKLAPVILALREETSFEVQVCATAQHKDILLPFLEVFNIPIDHNLDIMLPNQSLFDITVRTLQGLQTLLDDENPQLLMIQGDTTTAFASSLSAFYYKIPVAHVEAGLRTWDSLSPYPEEINRTLITSLARLHFAPTKKAQENLLAQSVPPEQIFVTGNTIVDALKYMSKQLPRDKVWEELSAFPELEKTIREKKKRLILLTSHRRESFGTPLTNICCAIKEIIKAFEDIVVVYPVHPNPHVQEIVYQILSNTPRVHLIHPISYSTLIFLLQSSYLVLTDSGGIQEEAPTFHVPVMVLRDKTERMEGIEERIALLVGTKQQTIERVAGHLLSDKEAYSAMQKRENPYGDGHASERIVEIVKAFSK